MHFESLTCGSSATCQTHIFHTFEQNYLSNDNSNSEYIAGAAFFFQPGKGREKSEMAASGLGLSTSFLPGHDTLLRRRRRRPAGHAAASFRPVTAELGGVATELGRQLVEAVGVGLPCTVMQCGDVIYRSTLPRNDGLTITAPGVALALATVSYLWSTPGVAPGFFDMFVLAFAERLFRPSFRKVRSLFRFRILCPLSPPFVLIWCLGCWTG